MKLNCYIILSFVLYQKQKIILTYAKSTVCLSLYRLKTCERTSQPAFTCSKLTFETLEQGVKYAQS